MTPRFKMIAVLASLVVAAVALRCIWLWQPERQLLLHQAHLRQAFEHRDWARIEKLLDPHYADRWGYTRDTGIRDARQWFGQFFALTITAEPIAQEFTGTEGVITERWKLDGTGTEAASMVEQSVNALHAPFVFHWKHQGWKPWDWTLTSVDNADLTLNPVEM